MTPTYPAPRVFEPGSFEQAAHFYPKVLNAHIHPLVRSFLELGNERIAARYCHLHPEADPAAVRATLSRPPRWFRWGGADLFHVATERGDRRVVVIETNSSPSGNKSMPVRNEEQEQAGYRTLLEGAFLPLLRRRGLPQGGVAALYDKNPMEVSGYAAAAADLCGEPVPMVPYFADDPDPPVRVDPDGVIHARVDGSWRPLRACFRYVTQRPWTRLPPVSRTAVFNPTLVCLAGGRNKLLAAKAYDLYNAELAASGLRILVPETIWDVGRAEVPLWVARLGGVAVVKDPYSNAGQGVYTITSPAELDAFMALEQRYDRFIVQALLGNRRWTSRGREGRLYHVGTVPDRKGAMYVVDLRFMVGVGPDGAFPVSIYARRARRPLQDTLAAGDSSWDMLGTNLSVRQPDGSWTTESERLLLMDARDFNRLGVGLDDLIEAYLQTVLAMTAIDRMADSLVTSKGRFRRRFFASLNPDPALVTEIMP